MKKTILLVKSLLLVGIFIVSCDDNDKPDCTDALTGELSATETAFIGQWMLKSIIAEEEIDLTDDDDDNPSTDIYSQNSDCKNDLVYTFETNRNYNLKQGENTSNCEELEAHGTWALSNNTLTVVVGCASKSTPLEFNDEDTEFSYTSTLRFKDVNDEFIDSKVVFTYEKDMP